MESKFFKIGNYIDHIIPKENKHFILIINAPRNIGKSYSAWELMEKEYLTEERKVLYIRNTKMAIDKWIAEFNNKFYGKFIATPTNIYNVRPVILKDSDGEEWTKFRKDRIVGYVAYMSSTLANKSLEFENVEFVFYEEYNEISNNNTGIFNSFINLVKSFERFKEHMKIIMVGNKDSANNEFMVKFGIEPALNTGKDELQQFSENGYFVDVAIETYAHLDNKGTLANELALFDDSMNSYLNEGGYIQDFTLNVVNFAKKVEPTFTPIIGLTNSLNEEFMLGSFIIDNSKKFCITAKLPSHKNLRNISISKFGNLKKGAGILEKEDMNDFLHKIFKAIKNEEMYYTSFDIKLIMETFASLYVPVV